MDRVSAEDRPQVRIPPPLVFLVFLIMAGLLEYRFGFEVPKGPPALRRSVALIAFLFSGYLALHAVVVLKKRGTFIDPGKPTTRVVEEGPFRFSRNPMYLSLVLVLFSLATWFLSIWFFLSMAGLWFVIDRFAVAPEEEYLERKFGGRYGEYKARVRRWF